MSIASQITDALNVMTLKPKEVAKDLCREHRTLQQNFMDVAIAFIKEAAKDNYGWDDRNVEVWCLANLLAPKIEELEK